MTLRRSLLLIALQSLLVFVVGFGLVAPRILGVEDPFTPTPATAALVVLFAVIGGFLLVYLGSVKQPGQTFRDLGWHTDRLGAQILLGVLGGLVCVALLVGTLLALGNSSSEILAHLTGYSLAERGLFLLIGVQAAFVEESLFRGNLQTALGKRMKPALALLLTAVVFALYHLNPNPVSLGTKTGIGLILGALAMTQRSLVAPAIAHALFWVLAGTL